MIGLKTASQRNNPNNPPRPNLIFPGFTDNQLIEIVTDIELNSQVTENNLIYVPNGLLQNFTGTYTYTQAQINSLLAEIHAYIDWRIITRNNNS